MRRCLLLFVALAGVAVPTAARAQAADPATVMELFNQGRDAMEKGDYATACPKLEASVKLSPHVGSLMSLAECEEHSTKLAAARAHLQQALGLARGLGDPRETQVQALLTALDPRVPRLTLRRALGAPAAMKVSRDGVELEAALFDVALPVEPGKHVVIASAEGFGPNQLTVELSEGQTKELSLQTGARLAPSVAPVAAAPVAAAPAAAPSAPEPPSRVLPVTLGVTGGVSLVTGSLFGVVALETEAQAKDACPGLTGCKQSVLSKSSAAGTEAWVADVAIPAGVVMLAGAAIWWAINRKAPPARATLGWQQVTVRW